MTPSPFGRHQAVTFALVAELRAAILSHGCGATALGELDWIISNDTVVRPDVIVICGGVPEKHLESPPDLIGEVLSPSTRKNDLTYKRELYQSQGVRNYLIVDPDAKTIQQLTLSPDGVYESAESVSKIKVTVCDGCEIEVESQKLFTQ